MTQEHARPTHGRVLKLLLGTPEVAAGVLRPALRAEVADQLRWETIRLEPGTFVNERLRQVETDLLFSVGTRQGGKAFVYVLQENQSTNDRRMPMRLLRYVLSVWEREDRKMPEREFLPCVISVLLANVPGGWSAPRTMHGILDFAGLQETIIGRYVPSFEYVVIDVLTEDLERFKAGVIGYLVLGAMRALRTGGVVAWVEREGALLKGLLRAHRGLDIFRVLCEYITGTRMEEEPKKVLEALFRVSEPETDAMQSIAEYLEERGMERGMERGREEGLEKGSLIGTIRAFKQVSGQDVDSKEVLKGLSLEELRVREAMLREKVLRR